MARIDAKAKEPVLLNKTELCSSLGISTTAFDKWGVSPHSKKGRQSLYLMADVVGNRVAHERKKHDQALGEQDPDKPNIEYERYRLTRAQAYGQELKNKKEDKEVVEAAFAIFVLAKVGAQAAPIFDQVPLRLKRKYPDLSEKVLDGLKAEIIKGQNIIAGLGESIEDTLDEYISRTA